MRQNAARPLIDARTLLDAVPAETKQRFFLQLEAMRPDALGGHRITVGSCEGCQSEMREWLQARIDAEDRRLTRLRDAILGAMRRYKTDWPASPSLRKRSSG